MSLYGGIDLHANNSVIVLGVPAVTDTVGGFLLCGSQSRKP
jgi:hypothetical protein